MFKKILDYFRPKPDMDDGWKRRMIADMDWLELYDHSQTIEERMCKLETELEETENVDICASLDAVRLEMYFIKQELDERLSG